MAGPARLRQGIPEWGPQLVAHGRQKVTFNLIHVLLSCRKIYMFSPLWLSERPLDSCEQLPVHLFARQSFSDFLWFQPERTGTARHLRC